MEQAQRILRGTRMIEVRNFEIFFEPTCELRRRTEVPYNYFLTEKVDFIHVRLFTIRDL